VPHRVADALLRDSIDDTGTPFRQTAIGKACTDARPNHATSMYCYCPTALLFGVWDSTGPRGGLGAKFQRVLVSEIVGHDVATGVKTASRIDPVAIERKAGPVFESKANPAEWTSVESEAASEKGKPRLFSRKGAGDPLLFGIRQTFSRVMNAGHIEAIRPSPPHGETIRVFPRDERGPH
jgi:CRISPR-associated protein Csb1